MRDLLTIDNTFTALLSGREGRQQESAYMTADTWVGRHCVCEVQKDAGLCTSVLPMCTESKPFPCFILSLLSPVSLVFPS